MKDIILNTSDVSSTMISRRLQRLESGSSTSVLSLSSSKKIAAFTSRPANVKSFSSSDGNPFEREKRISSEIIRNNLEETLVLNNSFRNNCGGAASDSKKFSSKDAKRIARMLNKYDEAQKFEELCDAEFIPTELKTTCIKNNVSALTILPFLAANEELWNYRFLLQMSSYLASNHVLSSSWGNIKFLVKQAEGILDQVLNDPRVVCKLIEKKTMAMLANTKLVNSTESMWKIALDSLFVNLSRYFEADNTTEKKLQRKHVQDKIQCQLLKKDYEMNGRNHFERITMKKSVIKRREQTNLITFDEMELNLDDLSSISRSSPTPTTSDGDDDESDGESISEKGESLGHDTGEEGTDDDEGDGDDESVNGSNSTSGSDNSYTMVQKVLEIDDEKIYKPLTVANVETFNQEKNNNPMYEVPLPPSSSSSSELELVFEQQFPLPPPLIPMKIIESVPVDEVVDSVSLNDANEEFENTTLQIKHLSSSCEF